MTTIATLFSGGEGVGVGARAAGLRHLWGVEYRADIAAVAEANGFSTIVADVLTVDPRTLTAPDVLHASPVCKNASVANSTRTKAVNSGTGRVYKKSKYQLWLPGMEPPFNAFDYWAMVGLYFMLDPKKPADPVETTPTDILDVLEFSKTIATNVDGYKSETYPSQNYRLIHETLHRLYSVELNGLVFWRVKLENDRGPKKQWSRIFGRILQEVEYIYKPGVTPPAALPASKRHLRKNVNQSKIPGSPTAPPAIWQYAEGPEPIGVKYQFASRWVNALVGKHPHIGWTRPGAGLFGFRKEFQSSPIHTNALFWVARQTKLKNDWSLKTVAKSLNLDPDRLGRGIDTLSRSFRMMKEAGVVTAFKFSGDRLVFARSPDWGGDPGEDLPDLEGLGNVEEGE